MTAETKISLAEVEAVVAAAVAVAAVELQQPIVCEQYHTQ